MSKQKHDIGNQKRRNAQTKEQGTTSPTPQALAHNLIERGLATKQILDAHSRGNRRTERP